MRYFPNLRYLFILSAILCVSCGTALPSVKPFKLDVQQGNVVTSKMLLQLRPGMTKSQVRFIMGTPLVQDSFHSDRWDYVYQMRENGKVIEQRRVILDFEKELLKSVRGDVVPSGSEAAKANQEAANQEARVVAPKAKAEEKSMLSRLKFWEKDEAAEKTKLEAEAAAKKAAEDSATQDKLNAAKVAAPVEPVAVLPVEEAPTKEEVIAKEEIKVEESKSLLSVPLDPVPGAPAVESAPVASPVEVAPAVPEVSAVAVPEMSVPAEPVPSPVPAPVPGYESPSGMLFDRTLKFAPEEVLPEVKPEPIKPRAGNTTPPKPKDLPAESEPGFFDRMLEKIGF